MTSPRTTLPSAEQVTRALDGVQDPEIHRPITELGMVKNIDIAADGAVLVEAGVRRGLPAAGQDHRTSPRRSARCPACPRSAWNST